MPYRNDEEAVRSRKEELERELADVKRRSAEFAYLEWRAKELETELADLSKRQAAFAKKKRLPMLDGAKIASPCNADWNQMVGDDHVRFCKSCEKNVYDLSSLTAEAAEALLVEKEGKLCARFYTRTDGTVLTADCPVGVRRKWVNRAGTAVVLFGSAAASAAAFIGREPPHATMGDIASPVLSASAEDTNEAMGVMEPPQRPATSATTTATTPHFMGHMGRVAPRTPDPKANDKPKAKPPQHTMGVIAVPGDPLASGI